MSVYVTFKAHPFIDKRKDQTSAGLYLWDVQGQGGCAHLWRQGGQRPQGPRSAQEVLSPRRPGTGLRGVALGECQERGETGAGAAAAVATGKGGGGEGVGA